MYVKLLNYLEVEQAEKVWKISRPLSDSRFEDICDLDLPVNEFIPINLEIKSTLLEREIFTSFRRHKVWARSSRVEEPLDFEVVDETINPNVDRPIRAHLENIRNRMRVLAESEAQDDYRLIMPLMAMTTYSISTDYRSLMKTVNYFDHLSTKIPHFGNQFADFSDMLFDIIKDISGKHSLALDNFKMDSPLTEDYQYYGKSEFSNGVITANISVPFHLRAQLVRHRSIGFSDNLFELMTDSSIMGDSMDTTVDMTIWGSVSDIQDIITKRNCWLANYKQWKNVISAIEQVMDGNALLPCSNSNNCPYHADAQLRIERKDPNPPCPRHMKLTNQVVDDIQRVEIKDMISRDERQDFWLKEI